MKYRFSALLFALVLLPTLAFAGSDNAKYDVCFNSINGNGDDVVTMAELKKTFPKEAPAIMKAADTNKSGDMDHDEWEAFKASKGIEDDH